MDDLAFANQQLARAGVVGQSRMIDGRAEYRFLVPLRDGRHVAITSAVMPRVEVGASVFAKMKGKLKKVAKSKAFRKFAKVASFVAPFAAAPALLVSGIGAAKKAAKKAPAKLAAPKPAPKPKAAPRPAPKASAKAKPAPKPKAAPRPSPKASAKAKPASRPSPKASAAPKPAPKLVKARPAPAAKLAAVPPSVEEEALAQELDPGTLEPLPEPEPELEPEPEPELEPEPGVIDTDGEDVTEESEAEEVGALLNAADAHLAAAGVEGRTRWIDGRCEYQYLVPLADGRRVSFTAAVAPKVEIGAGKVGKKIKAGLKKVVKSKAFGKMLGGLGKLASIVPIPGASTLGKGLEFAAKAQGKLSAKAKKKTAAAAPMPAAKPPNTARPAPSARPRALPAPGKPAAAAARQAANTNARPAPKAPQTRPLAATPGVMVQLRSGRRAIVTFVE